VTLDTNCLYELDAQDAPSLSLGRIRELGRESRIVVCVPAIAASERQPDGQQLSNFGQFRERLEQIGLESSEILRPIAYLGIAYLDWCVLSGPILETKERAIHEILFPSIAFKAAEHCPPVDVDGRRKWRNAKCDVQAMWCHIHYGGNIFITRDRNFHKMSKKSRIEALGAGEIATPEQAVAFLERDWQTKDPSL